MRKTAPLLVAVLGVLTDSRATVVKSLNDAAIGAYGKALVLQGGQTFHYDTFGDQVFWGRAPQLDKAIKGTAAHAAMARRPTGSSRAGTRIQRLRPASIASRPIARPTASTHNSPRRAVDAYEARLLP